VFTITLLSNGDIGSIQGPEGCFRRWNDPDFQAWNSAQQTPAALSAAQQAILNAKAMTFSQFQTWWTAATPAQQQRLLFELIQRTLRDEIV
jgi:hypothetical protein